MEIAAEDVVRRYLRELLRSRFTKKTDLARGMGTSRAQLQVQIREGRLTVDQINALAMSIGSSIWGIFREMSAIAEQMEKGNLPKLTEQELVEMLGGPLRTEEKQEEEILTPAEIDAISEGRPSKRAEARRAERTERASPVPRPRQSSDQPSKRSR